MNEDNPQQLTRQARTRVYPAFILGALGFVLGGLAFQLFGGHQAVVVTTQQRDPWFVADQAASSPGGTVGTQSTFKVDNLDVAGTTAQHGLLTLGAGITGLPVSTCFAGTAVTDVSTTGTASCSMFFNATGDHLSFSGSTVSLAPIATSRILGRVSAGPGNVEDLTGTQATTLLDPFTSVLKGLVPASGGGTVNFLRADGSFAVPPGTGVSSITAGQSITVTGTTTPTVALNFPTAACSAGQAVTSHNSAGTPSCSTFVNAAGTGLQLTGSSLAVNIAGASCSAGQAVTSISATGTGTCAAVGSSPPNNELLNGPDGACLFNGSTTPVCGATLSGSTYTMARDIFSSSWNVSNGVEVKTAGWAINNTGDINLNTSGKIDDNGNDASGGTRGAARAAAQRYGANAAGGTPGSSPDASSTAPGPWLTTLAATAAANPGQVGAPGGLCQGGSGGGGDVGSATAGGGAITINAVTSNSGIGNQELIDGRTRVNNQQFTFGSGGSGGGSGSTGNRGAGGASGGFVHIETDTFTATGGTVEAKGGAGAAATGNAGGGGGGGGGIIFARYRTNNGVTFVVTGGSGGAGAGGGKVGGLGGTCVVIKQNLSGDGT